MTSIRSTAFHPQLSTPPKPLQRPTPKTQGSSSKTLRQSGQDSGSVDNPNDRKRLSSPPPPVPTARPRSQQHPQQQDEGVQGPKQADLDRFEHACIALYFDKDDNAARIVNSTLQRLPPSHRQTYARLMAMVRSEYHLDVEIKGRKAVEDLFLSSKPGEHIIKALKISEGGTSAMRSGKAKLERRHALDNFITSHCVKGFPGTHPFFIGLYEALDLQACVAGKHNVQWEVDIAVFTEASAGTWMHDSISFLKRSLGCSEHIKHDRASMYDDGDSMSEVASQKSRIPPLIPPHRQPSTPPVLNRGRAPSDPFIDPGDKPSASTLRSESPTVETSLLHSKESSAHSEPAQDIAQNPTQVNQSFESRRPPPQTRVFTLPSYLTNAEIKRLQAQFPGFISQRSKARPRSSSLAKRVSQLSSDRELGDVMSENAGHGKIFVIADERDPGWKGTLWERFVTWLRGILGLK